MSPPDDTKRPPPLLGSLPESAEAPPIPAGGAQMALVGAFERFLAAFLQLEATSMAIARALDATAKGTTT